MKTFDAIILGGGAAGLMCAIEAGKRGRRVALLERSDRIGKKILISGGGRCNFTNIYCQPENFISANPHFAKSALARYTPSDFLELVRKHQIRYHEKTAGQLFCDGSAREIVTMLEQECRETKGQIFSNVSIKEVGHSSVFVVNTSVGEFRAAALVVATGGLSIPKIGATSFGYDLAQQFGLRIRSPWPGLVPLLLNVEDQTRFSDLAGVSSEVIASHGSHAFRDKMLITHRGLSGPAILQISSYCAGHEPIMVDLAPGRKVTAAFANSTIPRTLASLRSQLQSAIPLRLATRWLELNAPPRWSNSALNDFESKLHGWGVFPAGTEGYDKAEVTVGGVDTDDLSAKTMEARSVPGLFFIGEVVDVTGHLGGFNFQWAWASGASAGRAL